MDLPGPVRCHFDFFESIKDNLPEGDIIEFGVYNGGSTRQLARMGRRVWALDTYEGMPSQEYREDLGDRDPPGKFTPEINIWEMFKDYPNICPVQGRFVNTLSVLPRALPIAFAYMDCDLYESYIQTLTWLETHLVQKAIVLIDDYEYCGGCRKAVDEWVPGKNIDFRIAGDCRYFIWQ